MLKEQSLLYKNDVSGFYVKNCIHANELIMKIYRNTFFHRENQSILLVVVALLEKKLEILCQI